MKLTCENYDRIVVIGIAGELSADEMPKFEQMVKQQLKGDTRDFVLDLSETEFVDSQGLEAMLWLQEQADEQLGQVRLACCRENVRTILAITRLEHHFEQHDDIESALKSLR